MWQKLKTELKNLQHNFILLLWEKEPFLWKKYWFFAKKHADISKIKGALVLNGIISETKYVCVLSHQISSS